MGSIFVLKRCSPFLNSYLKALDTASSDISLVVDVAGHGVHGSLDLGELGKRGVGQGLVAEGLALELVHGAGVLSSQGLAEHVVDGHVGQGDLVAHREAVVAQGGLDAAHPPGEEAGGAVGAHSSAGGISGTLVEPLVEGLLGRSSAVGNQGTEGGADLLEVLGDRQDLGCLYVVGAIQSVLGGDVEVDGSRLTNTLITNRNDGHATKVGFQTFGRCIEATVNIITLIFEKQQILSLKNGQQCNHQPKHLHTYRKLSSNGKKLSWNLHEATAIPVLCNTIPLDEVRIVNKLDKETKCYCNLKRVP
jgi:hypothetical protein